MPFWQAEPLRHLPEGHSQLGHFVPAVRDGEGGGEVLSRPLPDLPGEAVQRRKGFSHETINEQWAKD